LTPKSIKEQFQGVATGQTVTVRVGQPFRANSLRHEGMSDTEHSRAIAAKLDQNFYNLSGRPIGPMYIANPPFWQFWKRKTPSPLFKAKDIPTLEKEVYRRLKNPKGYRHSAVVFPPEQAYQTGEKEKIIKILERGHFPQGQMFTVFHAIHGPTGQYRYSQYNIGRDENGFKIDDVQN
jgi:hypothetical protein